MPPPSVFWAAWAAWERYGITDYTVLERDGLRIGVFGVLVVLAACLLLSAIASVITIVSAIVKEPEEPQDGITWLDDMETEDIVLPEVQDWTDGITGVKP